MAMRVLPLDVDVRIAALRAALAGCGVSAMMPAAELEEELSDLRAAMTRVPAPPVEHRVVLKDRWYHRVEQVTSSFGPVPMMSMGQVRSADGVVDREATTSRAETLAAHEATMRRLWEQRRDGD